MGVGDRPWLLRGVTIGLALVVGVVAWLATREDDDPAAMQEQSETRLVSSSELAEISALGGHPVYWAGPMPGMELQATENADGSVQVRYLIEGAEASGESTDALTIGTYPLSDPTGALDAFAERPGSVEHRSRDGREVVVSTQSPTSAYFVSPDNTVQVEVYDPSPKRALALALSPRVRPVG